MLEGRVVVESRQSGNAVCDVRASATHSVHQRADETSVLFSDLAFSVVCGEFVTFLGWGPNRFGGELIVRNHFIDVFGLVNSKRSPFSILSDSHSKELVEFS
jgi:hypothetical protein